MFAEIEAAIAIYCRAGRFTIPRAISPGRREALGPPTCGGVGKGAAFCRGSQRNLETLTVATRWPASPSTVPVVIRVLRHRVASTTLRRTRAVRRKRNQKITSSRAPIVFANLRPFETQRTENYVYSLWLSCPAVLYW